MGDKNEPYKRWLRYAFDDLSWTQSNLKEKVWYGACFTAQQAAEKALKAYLLKHGRKAKKVHDLTALLEECRRTDEDFESLREECVTLTDYYLPTRYPDIAEFMHFTQQKAQEAYTFAEKIVGFVDKKCG